MMSRYKIKMSGIFYRNPRKLNFFLGNYSGDGNDQNWTDALTIKSRTLYQLSYIPISSLVWETQEGTCNDGGRYEIRTHKPCGHSLASYCLTIRLIFHTTLVWGLYRVFIVFSFYKKEKNLKNYKPSSTINRRATKLPLIFNYLNVLISSKGTKLEIKNFKRGAFTSNFWMNFYNNEVPLLEHTSFIL